jgi:hypothetical protein
LKTIDDELVLVQPTSQYTNRKCTNTFGLRTDVQVEKRDGGGGNSEDIWAGSKSELMIK